MWHKRPAADAQKLAASIFAWLAWEPASVVRMCKSKYAKNFFMLTMQN
jgi:hypothetical protein